LLLTPAGTRLDQTLRSIGWVEIACGWLLTMTSCCLWFWARSAPQPEHQEIHYVAATIIGVWGIHIALAGVVLRLRQRWRVAGQLLLVLAYVLTRM